ncbi:MAG: Mur ligase domain-containing protein [Chitinispirillales bacterium]|jgi:UDP-N-acetylmuramate--alanine ligase|nr:Mur ligase domain-containing protein [Chitinispirillales bacterium]
MSLFIEEKEIDNFHFVGILGIGMSAVAQYLAKDCVVGGSDRSLSGNSANIEDEKILKNQGIPLFLQDGSGINEKTRALVVSTAIESDNLDIKKANELKIPVFHRSQVLSAVVKKCFSISVTGTSGKSSVSAMIFHILDFAGYRPSFIGGANLHSLRKKGLLGNAFVGKPCPVFNEKIKNREILVFEADESDGSVVRYFPEISVLLNVSRDHKEISEVVSLLKTASNQSNLTIYNKDDKNFDKISGKSFGLSRSADYFPLRYSLAENSSTFTTQNASFVLNFTGEHTIKNALAAFAVCAELGLDDEIIAQGLASYGGIARRFDKYFASRNILLIDDYAHNPEKISSALSAAQMRKAAVWLVFQPHGFGPLKFMFDDLKNMFLHSLRPIDKLCLLPVFYVGGTADTSINSKIFINEFEDKNRFFYVETREKLAEFLKKSLKENETVLICGARDNSLSTFARDLAKTL